MSSDDSLTIEVSRSGAVCVVALSGRIDSNNAEQFKTRITEILSSGEKAVLLDFGEVTYLTSAAFRALLVATDHAKKNAARLVLCRMLGQVHELFRMVGLLDAFTIHGSKDEALASLD